MSWYHYWESKISFPFSARCVGANPVPPFRTGETTDVVRMAPEDACAHDMLVQIRRRGREFAFPLSQLDAIGADELTKEAVDDWLTGSRRASFSDVYVQQTVGQRSSRAHYRKGPAYMDRY